MILIISSETDQSTSDVIKWLIKNEKAYVRLGEQQFVNSLYFTLESSGIQISLKIGGVLINFDQITSFWFRKHTLEILSNLEIRVEAKEKNLRSPYIKEYLVDEEIDSIRQFLFYELEKKNHLGNFKVGDGNKLISFSVARDCGFKIPTSYISSDLRWLKQKFEHSDKLIVKPIEEAYTCIHNKIGITGNYDIAKASVFENKESTVFPSCLQSYLDKKMELRVFYLKGKCYSMAIFSQSNSKTKIDFRNYDDDKPNRFVPYKLPKTIETQTIEFMKKINLKTGSLDLVLTSDNEYIFLEVNPVGQYGMVSEPCNYKLDKKIARELAL